MNKRTILLYGRTNSGKTAQIGVLAEHIFKTTGKRTRLFTADRGGTDTIRPYIDLGIIEAIEMKDTDPWIFLNKAATNQVKDSQGKWVKGSTDDIGMLAYESMRAFAESLMGSMAKKAGDGVNIGGGSNIAFQINSEGESLKVSGSNMAHFGVAQGRVTEEIWTSHRNDVPVILWTSSVSKDDDLTAAGKVLGPDVIGKALTTEVPRWFNLTFRIDVLPAQGGKPERHILYLGNHVDVGAGNAAGLGNTRMPLDAPTSTSITIEPADIVKALAQIDGGTAQATEVIKKRLGNALMALKAKAS